MGLVMLNLGLQLVYQGRVGFVGRQVDGALSGCCGLGKVSCFGISGRQGATCDRRDQY